jgi:hypothetical protein
VVELFEAHKPREAAIIATVSGIVKFGEVVNGVRKTVPRIPHDISAVPWRKGPATLPRR